MDSASCSARTAASDSPEGEHGGRADRTRALGPPRPRDTGPALPGVGGALVDLRRARHRRATGGRRAERSGRRARDAGARRAVQPCRDRDCPAGTAAAGRRPRAAGRRAFLRGARVPGRAFRRRASDRRRAGGPHADASPRRVPGCQAGRPGGRRVPRQGAPLRRPAAPRSAACRTARRLRRPVADGHPLHVREHRAAQGGDAAVWLVLQLRPGVRRALRHRSRTTTSSCPCRSHTRPARLRRSRSLSTPGAG